MAGFSELPKLIIRKVAVEHLDNQEDFEAFREVCLEWRSETDNVKYIWPSKSTQLPWLMLVDSPTTSYLRFYSLSKHMFRKFHLPKFDEDADDHRRYFSSKGWLISVSKKRGLIHFIDVFSSHLIKPPSFPIRSLHDAAFWDEDDDAYLCNLNKFIFSNRPSSSSSSNFQVAMIFDQQNIIAFWRPGQQEWIKPVAANLETPQIEDVCFFRGEFYSIDIYARVIAYGNQTPKQARIVADLSSQGLVPFIPHKFYIVELQTTLLVIHREVVLDDDSDGEEYWTRSFELFEVNVDDGKATQIKDIGDLALSIGHNSTFFINASCSLDKRGCGANCVYFTDDYIEWNLTHQRGGGSDMGIFGLEEKKIVARFYEGPSQYNRVTPPMWLQLPPY